MNHRIAWLSPLALTLTLAACSGGDKMQLPASPTVDAPTPAADKNDKAPGASKALPSARKSIKINHDGALRGSGTTEPLRSSRVASSAMGRVTDIKVSEGDMVKKGQVMVQLDVRTSRLQAAQAGSNASAARVQAAQLKREVERMKPLV
jgi:multidrug efflux pump subunit AcrA (membrane-fusion protein)